MKLKLLVSYHGHSPMGRNSPIACDIGQYHNKIGQSQNWGVKCCRFHPLPYKAFTLRFQHKFKHQRTCPSCASSQIQCFIEERIQDTCSKNHYLYSFNPPSVTEWHPSNVLSPQTPIILTTEVPISTCTKHSFLPP
jgi:hypothetical protein